MDIAIDIEKLREDLIDYCGAAMAAGTTFAVVVLAEVESASPEELVGLARQLGIDPARYRVE